MISAQAAPGASLTDDVCFRVKYVSVDVASIPSQISMLQEVLSWLGQGEAVDALVLSAGINGTPFDLTPVDPFALADNDVAPALEAAKRLAATVQINLISILQCTQLVVKYGMGLRLGREGEAVSLGRKSVTLIGSMAGYRALPRAADYSASKWGARGAFRSLRQQLPKVGVRINMIAPAFVKTPLLAQTVAMYDGMGVKFAAIEDVVTAAVTAVNDHTRTGRTLGVTAHGIKDLNDDAEGMDAWQTMNELISEGALGSHTAPMVSDN